MVGHNKVSVPLIDYEVLEKATNVFQESNILGEGGFGRVYKARLEQNLYVAVKKLECNDKDAEKEFEVLFLWFLIFSSNQQENWTPYLEIWQNEVDLLSKIQHSNIIRLLGYTIHGESRLIVYELMENGSLETLLHGKTQNQRLSYLPFLVH